ncbi:patatin-like phospholipase family protein [Pelagibacterium sediminicola]|uniref:patatin-like phospholipase family protein n=1 Tax=Pelagibacterium sediminicola TaxID=2248761 RepID=UPI000E32268C|nr:cyclic nucleotide-binding and patatin-like phospholipase domain-containing protein [Pelagibacterium sediminicola]
MGGTMGTRRTGTARVLGDALAAHGRRRSIKRGDLLFRADERCESFFLVERGVFAASSDKDAPATYREFQTGDLIGELAFFGEGCHGETVAALRDCEVLEISRSAYAAALGERPSIATELLGHLAKRASAGDVGRQRKPGGRRRTIAFVRGGHEPVPPAFIQRMQDRLKRDGLLSVDRAMVSDHFGALPLDDPAVAEWLDRIENDATPVFYFGDDTLTGWTEFCIRQADEVVLVTSGDAPTAELSAVEKLVEKFHPQSACRLVRLHRRRCGVVEGTAAWLERTPVFLHHHMSLEDNADIDALIRFLTGRALGFVAGGGGGYGPAHVGIYRAFHEQGATFDIFMGTSVGAAMLAGFAFLGDHDTLTAGTQDIFVKSGSFKRPTWPRYALLDHKAFDDALARAYGADTRVEDCWKPFFAIATNLSSNRMEIIRSGLLWQAVRASSAIPCVLPPFFAEDGRMLVDGGVMDDAPLGPMQEIKAGPNLVVHFGREGDQRFNIAYDSLPGRAKLLISLINPRARLPRAPRLMSMLFRTILAHQRYDLPVTPQDLVLSPPRFSGASVMSFDRHMDVFNAAHAWALNEISVRKDKNEEVIDAVLGRGANGKMPLAPEIRQVA